MHACVFVHLFVTFFMSNDVGNQVLIDFTMDNSLVLLMVHNLPMEEATLEVGKILEEA